MKFSKTIPNPQSGDSLGIALVFMGVLLVLMVAVFGFTRTNMVVSARRVSEQAAIQLAEAGVEKAVWCLNNTAAPESQCPGNPSYFGETNTELGRGTYSVSWDSLNHVVVATGTVTSGSQTITKQVRVQLQTSSAESSFIYGVQTGTGGIVFNNNAKILGSGGTPGNVYVAGPVSIVAGNGNGSEISGDAFLSISNPTIDAQADPSGPPYTTFDIRGTTSTRYVVQSFTPTMTDKVVQVSLKMARTAASPSNPTLSIYYDNGSGKPGTLVSGAQITINASSLPVSSVAGWQNAFRDFVFTPETLLSAGVRYWLVLQVSGADGNKYFSMVKSTDADAYAGGTALTGNTLGSSAELCSTPTACDIAFQVKMGGVQPSLEVATVGGDAHAYTMISANIGGTAYYRNVTSNDVKANAGTVTCHNDDNTAYCVDIDVAGGDDPDLIDFPISDQQVAIWEAAAELGGTVTCGGDPDPCAIGSGSIGPVKYIGDVTIGGTVTLTGTVWVQGNITLVGNLVLSEAYGSSSGVIIADNQTTEQTKVTSGRIIAQNNSMLMRNSTAGTYIMAVAMSASLDPAIAAFDISNNFSKQSIEPTASAVVYAPKGVVKVLENGEMKEVIAQKLYLENNATVTYESGLSSVLFSSGPGASWTYQRGTYQIL